MWWCPRCENVRRASDASCPQDGTLRELVPMRRDPQFIAPRRPVEVDAWVGVLLEERDPVSLGRICPWPLWIGAIAVLSGLAQRFPWECVGRRWLWMVVVAALLLGAVGLAHRAWPELVMRLGRSLARLAATVARPLLPRESVRRRLVAQRQVRGDLVGVEIDDPSPWPLQPEPGALRFRGRLRTQHLFRAQDMTLVEGPEDEPRMVSAPATSDRFALSWAVLGVYLLLAAALGW